MGFNSGFKGLTRNVSREADVKRAETQSG